MTGNGASVDLEADATVIDAYSQTVMAVAGGSCRAWPASRSAWRVANDCTGQGHAVVISEDGFLVTSAHVVERSTWVRHLLRRS
jgi:hypothetical protein